MSEQLQNNCSVCFGEIEGQMVKFCDKGRGGWAESASDHNCTVCTAHHLPKKGGDLPVGWKMVLLGSWEQPAMSKVFVKCVPMGFHGGFWAVDPQKPG